jgi:hypothetical protein
MFYVLYSVKDDPIMTMGDAVSSFLQNEDTKTRHQSLSGFQTFREGCSNGAKVWENAQLLWKDATSKNRRATPLVMWVSYAFLYQRVLTKTPAGSSQL